MNDAFDLIDTQQQVREMSCPKMVFEAWNGFLHAHRRRELSQYELDEMKAVVWEQFHRINGTSRLSIEAE